MTETKKFYKSKTVITNLLLILGGVSIAVAGEIDKGAGLTIIGIVEIVLRVLTKEKLS